MPALRDLKLTDNFDLALESNEVPTVECQYAAAQAIRVGLQIEAGEWPLDVRVGVPYRDRILVKNPNIGLVTSLLIAGVLACEGVLAIRDYTVDWDQTARSLTMILDVQTVWCEIQVQADVVTMDGLILITILGPAGPF